MKIKIVILVLMLIVGLIILTGCKDEPEDENNNGNNNNTTTSGYSISGDNLTLSGQVYILDQDESKELGELIIRKCNDSFDVYTYSFYDYQIVYGNTGTVKNGQLSLSMGKPDVNWMLPIIYYHDIEWGYKEHIFYSYNIVSSEIDANLYILHMCENYYYLYDNIYYYTNLNFADEMVSFLYVDKDVNIRAEGYTSYDHEYSALNLSLKAGWNAVSTYRTYSKTTVSQNVPSGQWMWLLVDD